MDDCVVVICVGAVVIYLSYSVGWGLMGADTDLFSGSGFITSSLSSSSSDSSRLCLSSFRSSLLLLSSSLLLLSSSLLLLSSSLLWLFLDLPTWTAFPQFPARNGTADGAQGTEVRNKMNPRWPKWSYSAHRALLTYGEFKGHWFGSYRRVHHSDFKQRRKQQKILPVSQETLKTKKQKQKRSESCRTSLSPFSTWNTLSPESLS